MNYLNKLQERTDFSCSSVQRYDGENVGFTDFIYHLESCTAPNGTIPRNDPSCKCDIGVAGFAMNNERFGRVDYLVDFVSGDYRVITHIDNTKTSTSGTFFITTFSPSVWLGIVGLSVVFIFLKLLDRRFAPPDGSYQPLSKSENWFRRWRHFLLRSRIPFRLRKAVESTRTFNVVHYLSNCIYFLKNAFTDSSVTFEYIPCQYSIQVDWTQYAQYSRRLQFNPAEGPELCDSSMWSLFYSDLRGNDDVSFFCLTDWPFQR